MATIKRFEDIEAWQKARELDRQIFSIVCTTRIQKDYALRDQMLRSSGSIMDNIAEGFERGGKGEFVLFLGYSKGSTGELRSQLYRAHDRKYITEPVFNDLYAAATEISKMEGGFIDYLQQSKFRGAKYRPR